MNKRKNGAPRVRVIPVRKGWNEDDDEDVPYIRATRQPSPPPAGYYSKAKVWTIICVIVFLYFRFSS